MKWPEIQSPPNIVHAKYNTCTVISQISLMNYIYNVNFLYYPLVFIYKYIYLLRHSSEPQLKHLWKLYFLIHYKNWVYGFFVLLKLLLSEGILFEGVFTYFRKYFKYWIVLCQLDINFMANLWDGKPLGFICIYTIHQIYL